MCALVEVRGRGETLSLTTLDVVAAGDAPCLRPLIAAHQASEISGRERERARKTRDKTEERREKREKRREKAKREREERERRESARAREIQTPYKGNTHTGEPLRTNNKHVPVHVSLIHTLAHHPLRRSPSRAPVLPLSFLLAPSPYILHAHTSSTCKPSGANCCAFSKSS